MGWAIYSVNGALIVFSCFLVANIANQWNAEMLAAPVEVSPKERPDLDDESGARPPEHRVILDRNLFGAIEGEAPPVIEKEPEIVVETKLPLRLLGTAAASDPDRSTAALENTSSRKSQVVKVGDFLEGLTEVSVVGIERKRIVLDNRGTREELKLEEELASNIRPAPPAARPTARSRRDDRTSALADRLRDMQGQQDDRRSPSALFSQGRILPEYENGQMIGIKVDKIQPGGFYDQIGLTDGTVVTNINGIQIDSPSATKDILRALTEEKTLEVTTLDGSVLNVDTNEILENVE